ncbi:MAG: hypothetical protein JXO72_13460 [Vicinamibacteria bacterium]|nr:hypothetical protein [Vicinamibacteria bacterium]
MHEYSPRRRTAVVFSGVGTAGAYHAGVLKALEESGVKVDLVVGSGIGAVAAAFAAVSAGDKLYGIGGFWEGVKSSSFYRIRRGVRLLLILIGAGLAAFALPVLLAVIAGVLSVPALLIDLFNPGWASRALTMLGVTPQSMRAAYGVALSVPAFALFLTIAIVGVRALLDRRRFAESLQAVFDARPAHDHFLKHLWEAVRGPSLSPPASAAALGERYLAFCAENEGQPRFRRLILRTADLDTGRTLCFALLDDDALGALSEARKHGGSPRDTGVVDLRSPGAGRLLVEAMLSALLPPLLAPLTQVVFPKGGVYASESHRLADGTLSAGCGVADALAAGAEQVVLVSSVPVSTAHRLGRRGPWAVAESLVALIERQALERDIHETERINRLIESLGAVDENGEPGWQDPATGKLYRAINLYVVRPRQRALGPLSFDDRRDPDSEAAVDLADLVEQGHHDAYYQFVEPVVGSPALADEPDPLHLGSGRKMQL